MEQDQARQSLAEISNARRRLFELVNYNEAAPVVTIWGCVWLAGFLAEQLWPETASIVWLVGWVIALGWTIMQPRQPNDLQVMSTWAVAVGFAVMLILVLQVSREEAAVIFALVLSASYATLGIWIGRRFLFLSAVVFAAAMLGWWVFPEMLFLLLAISGGAAFILAGYWLRRP